MNLSNADHAPLESKIVQPNHRSDQEIPMAPPPEAGNLNGRKVSVLTSLGTKLIDAFRWFISLPRTLWKGRTNKSDQATLAHRVEGPVEQKLTPVQRMQKVLLQKIEEVAFKDRSQSPFMNIRGEWQLDIDQKGELIVGACNVNELLDLLGKMLDEDELSALHLGDADRVEQVFHQLLKKTVFSLLRGESTGLFSHDLWHRRHLQKDLVQQETLLQNIDTLTRQMINRPEEVKQEEIVTLAEEAGMIRVKLMNVESLSSEAVTKHIDTLYSLPDRLGPASEGRPTLIDELLSARIEYWSGVNARLQDLPEGDPRKLELGCLLGWEAEEVKNIIDAIANQEPVRVQQSLVGIASVHEFCGETLAPIEWMVARISFLLAHRSKELSEELLGQMRELMEVRHQWVMRHLAHYMGSAGRVNSDTVQTLRSKLIELIQGIGQALETEREITDRIGDRIDRLSALARHAKMVGNTPLAAALEARTKWWNQRRLCFDQPALVAHFDQLEQETKVLLEREENAIMKLEWAPTKNLQEEVAGIAQLVEREIAAATTQISDPMMRKTLGAYSEVLAQAVKEKRYSLIPRLLGALIPKAEPRRAIASQVVRLMQQVLKDVSVPPALQAVLEKYTRDIEAALPDENYDKISQLLEALYKEPSLKQFAEEAMKAGESLQPQARLLITALQQVHQQWANGLRLKRELVVLLKQQLSRATALEAYFELYELYSDAREGEELSVGKVRVFTERRQQLIGRLEVAIGKGDEGEIPRQGIDLPYKEFLQEKVREWNEWLGNTALGITHRNAFKVQRMEHRASEGRDFTARERASTIAWIQSQPLNRSISKQTVDQIVCDRRTAKLQAQEWMLDYLSKRTDLTLQQHREQLQRACMQQANEVIEKIGAAEDVRERLMQKLDEHKSHYRREYERTEQLFAKAEAGKIVWSDAPRRLGNFLGYVAIGLKGTSLLRELTPKLQSIKEMIAILGELA